MAKKRAVMDFSGVTLAEIITNTVLGYSTGAAFALPYAGAMSRSAKERNGELYYDGALYAVVNEILGEEIEMRFAEIPLAVLANLGLGVYDPDTETLEANFAVVQKSYALRCITGTLSDLPFYFKWRVFDLTSIRFDNFATKDTSVKVCELIVKGICRKPEMPTIKPWAIRQLKEDRSNLAACEAFMANAETLPVSSTPVITITQQPQHAGVIVGDVADELAVTATATLDAVLAYQWYENDTLANVGGQQIAGAAAANFAIPADITEGSHYYYCVVSAPGAEAVATQPVVVSAIVVV